MYTIELRWTPDEHDEEGTPPVSEEIASWTSENNSLDMKFLRRVWDELIHEWHDFNLYLENC